MYAMESVESWDSWVSLPFLAKFTLERKFILSFVSGIFFDLRKFDAKGKSEPNIFSQSMVESKTSQKTNPSIQNCFFKAT